MKELKNIQCGGVDLDKSHEYDAGSDDIRVSPRHTSGMWPREGSFIGAGTIDGHTITPTV